MIIRSRFQIFGKPRTSFYETQPLFDMKAITLLVLFFVFSIPLFGQSTQVTTQQMTSSQTNALLEIDDKIQSIEMKRIKGDMFAFVEAKPENRTELYAKANSTFSPSQGRCIPVKGNCISGTISIVVK